MPLTIPRAIRRRQRSTSRRPPLAPPGLIIGGGGRDERPLLDIDPNAGVKTAAPVRPGLPDHGGQVAAVADQATGRILAGGSGTVTWDEYFRRLILGANARGWTAPGVTVAGRTTGALAFQLWFDGRSDRHTEARRLCTFGDIQIDVNADCTVTVRNAVEATEATSTRTYWGSPTVQSVQGPFVSDNDGTLNPWKDPERRFEFTMTGDTDSLAAGDVFEVEGWPEAAALGRAKVGRVLADGRVSVTFPSTTLATPTAGQIAAGIRFRHYGRRSWYSTGDNYTDQLPRLPIMLVIWWDANNTHFQFRDRIETVAGSPIAAAKSADGFTLGSPTGSATDTLPMRLHRLQVRERMPEGADLDRLHVDLGIVSLATNREGDRHFWFSGTEFPSIPRNQVAKHRWLWTVRDRDGNIPDHLRYPASDDIDTLTDGHPMTGHNPIINPTEWHFAVCIASKGVPTEVERADVRLTIFKPDRAWKYSYAIEVGQPKRYGVVRTIEARPPEGWTTEVKPPGTWGGATWMARPQYRIVELASGTHGASGGYSIDLDDVGGDIIIVGPEDRSAVLQGAIRIHRQRSLLRNLDVNYASGNRYLSCGYPPSVPAGIAVGLTVHNARFRGGADTYCLDHAGTGFHIQRYEIKPGNGYGAFLSPGTEYTPDLPDAWFGPTSMVAGVVDPQSTTEHDIRTLGRPHMRIAGTERITSHPVGTKTCITARWITDDTVITDAYCKWKPIDWNAHAALTSGNASIFRCQASAVLMASQSGAFYHCVGTGGANGTVSYYTQAANWGRKPLDSIAAYGCRATATSNAFDEVASAPIGGGWLQNGDGNGTGITIGGLASPPLAYAKVNADGWVTLKTAGFPVGGGAYYVRMTLQRRPIGQEGAEEDVPGWGSDVAEFLHIRGYEYRTKSTQTGADGVPDGVTAYGPWRAPDAGPLVLEWDMDAEVSAGSGAAGFDRSVPRVLSDPTPPQFGAGSTWVACWVNHTSINNDGTENQMILHAYDAGSAVVNTHQLYLRRDGSQAYVLSCYDTSGVGSGFADSGVVPVAGRTYFLFGAWDPANDALMIRVDDGPIVSVPFAGTQSGSIDVLTFGASWNGAAYQNGMNGRIEDLMIGRSASGIADPQALADALYNGGQGIRVPELTAQQISDLGITSAYALDEASGAARADSVGPHDLDGTTTATLVPGRFNPLDGRPIDKWPDWIGRYILANASESARPIYRDGPGLPYAEFASGESLSVGADVVTLADELTIGVLVRHEGGSGEVFKLAGASGELALSIGPSGNVIATYQPDGISAAVATSQATMPTDQFVLIWMKVEDGVLSCGIAGIPGVGTATPPGTGGIAGASATVGSAGLDVDVRKVVVEAHAMAEAELNDLAGT